MNLIRFTPQDSELAPKTNNIHDLIKQNASSIEIIPYIKILTGQCAELSDHNLQCRPGDMLVKPDDIVLGKEAKVLIGPWRIKGMTIENGVVKRVDYNLTKNSRYDPSTNQWIFPDGVTPTLRDIQEGPSDGTSLLNDVGYDVLFYLIEYKIGAVLWIKKTALTMSKIFQLCERNLGKVATLYTDLAKSKKFNWHLPHIRIDETQPTSLEIAPEFNTLVQSFLNPGVYYIPPEEGGKPR